MKTILKHKKLTVYLLAILVVAFSSCNKYLDKKTNSSLVTPSTLTDLQALLDDAVTMNQQRTPSYSQAAGDEYFLSNDQFNSLGIQYQSAYIWQPYFYSSNNDWSNCYQPIYNANLVLDLIKNIPRNAINKQQWDNVKGSALFYRSYYFLQLLWNYAKAYDSTTAGKDLGIALRLTSDFNVKSTRATNQACYGQVIEDTKTSIPLLPSLPEHVLRPSAGAAYGLLARCYLSMRDYDNALIYADSCLQLNNGLMDYNGDPDINSNLTINAPFKQFNKETIFDSQANTYYYLFETSIIGSVDTSLMQSYKTNDLRVPAYFFTNSSGYSSFKGSYTASIYSVFTGIATDEMYLTRAECYIRENKIQAGLNDLDTLLIRRYKTGTFIPLTAGSQSDALNMVLNERRKELVTRGLRWMDIKRLNKEGRNIILNRMVNGQTYTLKANANFYALPLPDDIIKITGMPQNEP